MSFDLLQLPPHVVEYILSCLGKDRPTLLQSRLVCRQLNNMMFGINVNVGFTWERMQLIQERGVKCDKAKEKALGFLEFLPNVADYVKHLTFRTRKEVPVAALQSLPTMPALTTLDLSENVWLSTQYLQQFAKKCDNVGDINLTRCYRLDDLAFIVISNNWASMECINISRCYGLNDINGRMSQFHDTLSSLRKYNCERVIRSDSHILRLLNRDGVAEKLVEVRVEAVNLTDASSLTAIGRCASLETFSARFCRNLTDASLQPLKSMSSLNRLHLHGGFSFTANALLTFFKEAPFRLEYLSLSGLIELNDAAMKHIVQRNGALQVLCIDCGDITDTGLANINELTELRILKCTRKIKVYGSFLDFDPRRLPNLRFIDLWDCGVYDAVASDIRRRFNNVFVAADDRPFDRNEYTSIIRETGSACCMSFPW